MQRGKITESGSWKMQNNLLSRKQMFVLHGQRSQVKLQYIVCTCRAKWGSLTGKVKYIQLSVPGEVREEKLEYYQRCSSHRENGLYYHIIYTLTMSISENEMGWQAVASWHRTTWHSTHVKPKRHTTPILIATWHITGLLQGTVLHCWEQCAPHWSDS